MKTLCLIALLVTGAAAAPAKRILFIAGPKSHGPGQHEHPASCELLARHLRASGLGLQIDVSTGWPADPAQVTAADTVVVYGDGLESHPLKGHLPIMRERLKQGKGLMVMHWALEPADAEMAAFMHDALGGYFAVNWSVNPIWKLTQPSVANHPATRGVHPFEVEDEFYYHLRLRNNVLPLLQALPPKSSLGADGPRSANPAIRDELAKGIPQTLAWCSTHASGARGFGFTGGHFFHLWANDHFRRLILNGIVWSAGVEVPPDGVTSNLTEMPAYQTIGEAITKGDLTDVKRHLALAPINARQDGRPGARPPLEQAILRKRQAIALELIRAGADPNLSDTSQRTPLHLAVERNLPELIVALLKHGARPDERDKDGWTPLHHAAAKNQLGSAQALLDGGAKPMTLSALGGTPLHEAAASGGAGMIQLLLKHHVDPQVRSKQGLTALDIARQFNNAAAIEALAPRAAQ